MKPGIMFPALFLLMTTTTLAAEREGAFSLSPYVGGYSFDGGQHAMTRPVYGLRAGYSLTRNWGMEGVVAFTATERTTTGEDFHHYAYHLDLLYNFMPDRKLVPYVAAGAGGMTEDRPGANDTDAAVNYGGGVKYYLTDSVAVRGDLRHLIRVEGETLHNWEYTAGLTFVFGGARGAMPDAGVAAPVAQPPSPPVSAPATEPPLSPPSAAEPTADRMKYCISMYSLFDINQSVIKEEFRDEVARVGTFMQRFPSTTAVIQGHADEVGTCEHNQDLSQKRAESVVTYLVEQFGIARSRLSAMGYGKNCPVTDNSTEEGRRRNRRIDAVIDCAIDIKGLKPVPDRLCMMLKMDFDQDAAVIKPQFESEIAKVADFMKQYPEVTALVEGHTDNTGSPEHNMKLSQMRAENVVNHLVQAYGIDRTRLAAKGFGDTRRIAYNNTPEGRAQNRRVNVILDCVIKK